MYATLAELYVYGAPERSLTQLTDAQKLAELASASTLVDTYLRGRYSLPLVSWDSSITEATCKVATYNLFSIRGYNPASGADVNIRDRYNEALIFLNKVQKQQAHPNVASQNANAPEAQQPMVISSSVVNVQTGATAQRRGW